MSNRLPIHDILPELTAAMAQHGVAVLQAPPGAGKTTVVPLALLEADIGHGRIVMLEPRRLAARTAAERMATTLGEKVGQTVGYRIRGEAKVGKTTRIEVVTEGILTRMIQSDADLPGIDTVIFDEFHERSLNADLGLALCCEIRAALRDDLNLLVMSATLDAAPVANLLNAPVVTAEGRAFPVETRWLDHPLPKGARFEQSVSELVLRAIGETSGDMLVFLPGEGEIRRVESLLSGQLPDRCQTHPLFGAMPFADQRRAIRPAPEGQRKIVLATAIAETSLTIEGVRVVVDAGRARRARFDPGIGMSRLVTERVTKAEATQRQGRAGRVAEGICYRMWTRGEEGALAAFAPAEIETADLAGLVLELALWGTTDPSDMAFLTAPNPGAWAEAQALLRSLAALDDKGRITAHGRQLSAMPLHPRLAHMLVVAGRQAAPLAAVLSDRDPLERGAPIDLVLRLSALANPRGFQADHPWQVNRSTLERVRAEAKRLARLCGEGAPPLSPGAMAALAYPDRIGLRRKGNEARFILSGGNGVTIDAGDPTAGARLIVATETDGARRDAKVRLATTLTESELRETFANQIVWHDVCAWSDRENRVIARQQESLGALVLADRNWRDPPPEVLASAVVDGFRALGLPWSKPAARLQARVRLIAGPDWPDFGEEALLDSAEDWLAPHVTDLRSAADIRAFDIYPALHARLDWDQQQELAKRAPAHWETPLGHRAAIDYSGEQPTVELRLQEVFGVTTHPTVAGKPLRLTLLSPARRPVQVTTDLPGFWASSYADVRKDMRGRYPKHPWPEDPTKADPTLRAKPRK